MAAVRDMVRRSEERLTAETAAKMDLLIRESCNFHHPPAPVAEVDEQEQADG